MSTQQTGKKVGRKLYSVRTDVHTDVDMLLLLARKYGAKRLKVGDFEVELGPDPAAAPPGKADEKALTEEDLLFASTSGGAPDFKDGEPVFTTRLPFGGVKAAGKPEEPA